VYKNVFTILGKLGGFMNGILLLMFLIVYPIREVLYYRKLINEMFTVCLTPEDFKKTMGVTVGMKIKKKKGEEVPKTEDEE
jgi:hypothetical protein